MIVVCFSQIWIFVWFFSPTLISFKAIYCQALQHTVIYFSCVFPFELPNSVLFEVFSIISSPCRHWFVYLLYSWIKTDIYINRLAVFTHLFHSISSSSMRWWWWHALSVSMVTVSLIEVSREIRSVYMEIVGVLGNTRLNWKMRIRLAPLMDHSHHY